jgi:hypothetical protein
LLAGADLHERDLGVAGVDEGLDLLDVLVDVGAASQLLADVLRVTSWVALSKESGLGRLAFTFQPSPNQRNSSWARRIAASRSMS